MHHCHSGAHLTFCAISIWLSLTPRFSGVLMK
jgi:hypothetical protein